MNKLMVSLAVLLAACPQVLGVDDFAVNGPDASVHAPGKAGGLFDPKAPYLASDPCRACLRINCRDENAACEADNACKKLFADKRAQPGPLADYQQRYLPPAAGQQWAYPHGVYSTSPVAAVDARLDCIETRCLEACDVGRDFSCSGAFDWPDTEPGAKKVSVEFSNEMGKRDWRVELCLGPGTCDVNVLHSETDSSGRTDLYIGPDPLSSGFSGYLRVTSRSPDPDALPFIYIFRPAPILSGMLISEPLISRRLVDEPFTAIGGPLLTPERGAVWVFPTDCRGDTARHVVVDFLIASDAGRGYLPCPECRGVIYTNDEYRPDAGRGEVNSRDGRAILSDLPLRNILVLVRDTATRRVLSQQQLLVRGGSVSVVRTYPASARELAGLPANIE